jgi:hypothetical protein
MISRTEIPDSKFQIKFQVSKSNPGISKYRF